MVTEPRLNSENNSSGLAGLSPLETSTLHTQVYESLARGVMSGAFRPGETLSYQRIADQFGVSQMPVRDALRRLAAEGAVLIAPKRGVRIPHATAARLEELTRVRIALEGLATERATARMTLRLIESLKSLADKMVRHAQLGEWRLYIEQNQAFHFAIYSAAGSEVLDRLIAGLWLQIGPIMTYFGEPRISDSLTLHSKIIKALQDGDGSAARQLMEDDINDGAGYLLALMPKDD